MATIQEFKDSIPAQIEGIDNNIAQLNAQIAELTDTRLNLKVGALDVARAQMVSWLDQKVASYTNPAYDYRWVAGPDFWGGADVSSIGTPYPNLSDWEIQEMELPAGSWVAIYTFNDAVSEAVQVVIDADNQFNVVWEQIGHDPSDLDGTFGISAAINNLNLAVTMLGNDKTQLQDIDAAL